MERNIARRGIGGDTRHCRARAIGRSEPTAERIAVARCGNERHAGVIPERCGQGRRIVCGERCAAPVLVGDGIGIDCPQRIECGVGSAVPCSCA